MVTDRFERMVRQVRGWRPAGGNDALRLDPALPEADLQRLKREIDDCISARGGEVASRRRAQAIGTAFLELDADGRRRMFELLAQSYDYDDGAVDLAVAELTASGTARERSVAVHTLREATRPRYERLLRRFNSFNGGLPFLVDLREDLLDHRRNDPGLSNLDLDLRTMLEGWFDVGLLELREITWQSPAALLEKLIEYEAVHAIESWDDLRGRLGTGRRCFAFIHPAMPGEPLIFVEVALERGIPISLPGLLDHQRERTAASAADTAVFYSISNCHRGLAGVSLGDFLIKRVVEMLSAELPNLKHFVTLSPIPGFRDWLEQQPDTHTIPTQLDDLDLHRDEMLHAAATYLATAKRKLRAADPVAHFHLSNGAHIERLNWRANPSGAGWDRSLGIMVNYYYRIKGIEENHDRYLAEGHVAMSDGMKKLLEGS